MYLCKGIKSYDEPLLNPSLTRPRNYPPLFPDFVAYAQAIHMGEGKGEAPTLQETFPRVSPEHTGEFGEVGIKLPG